MKVLTGLGGAAAAAIALTSFYWFTPGAAQETAATIAMDPAAIGLRIQFETDQPAEWTGQVRVSPGSVARMDIWEANAKARVDGARFSLSLAGGRRRQARGISPELFVTLAASPNSQVELDTNHGTARFSLADTTVEKPLAILNGGAQVQRAPAAFRLTRPGHDDDYPAAAAAPDGSVWAAYASYQSGPPENEEAILKRQFDSLVPTNNGDRIFLIHYDGRQWSAPQQVTEGLRDLWRPAVAVDGKGGVWVTWSEQRDGNWDLYQRRFDPKSNKWSAASRLTQDPGADVNVVSVRDSKGQVWWAWQGWRGDNFNILLASQNHSQAIAVADSTANEWSPAIAADSAGNVYVAWDSYASGSYDVLVRRVGAQPGKTIPVADTAYFEAKPSLACDSAGRVWIAYEEDDANWGKDYANSDPNRPVPNLGIPLYLNRRVKVKVLSGDQVLLPADHISRAYAALDRPTSFPRLAADSSGNIWLFFRHHARPTRAGEVWSGSVARYDGRQWSSAQLLPSSDYIMDDRPALVPWKSEGVLAVYASDGRLRTPAAKPETGLFSTVLSAPAAVTAELAADNSSRAVVAPIHPREAENIARVRAYRIQAAGKTYQLLRGEFHRHSEFTSHRDQDGGFEDLWRYGLDAASMDWIGDGDHDNGRNREYVWWIIQKVTDIFHNPPNFVPPFTYERSVLYPNGHRNVMFTHRGIRPLPRGPLPGTPEEGTPDTKLLYAYLHHFNGICASHTSGTRMGTDWRDNDPEVEPVVEIYQGHRNNYEHFGAPRSATPKTQIGGYQPSGYVWNAWARGYRLGIESSSDHVSTHISYTMVLAEQQTREALVDALRKRHSYGATDNIVLDVRSGEHLMGDEFSSGKPVRLTVKVIGTGPIRRVFIISNSAYVYEYGPAEPEMELSWQDNNQPAGTLSYYYVRVEQEDDQLAWSSPIWVHHE